MDTFNELQDMIPKLDKMLTFLKQRGKALAKAEHDYKIALRQEILKLRDDGQPATIVRDLCYGTPSIAKLRMERDIADALYKSIQEAINVEKLKCRIWGDQLSREWSHAGKV